MENKRFASVKIAIAQIQRTAFYLLNHKSDPMKKNRIILPVLIIALSLISGGMFAQLKVSHINSTAVPLVRQGVFYALPRTVVNVEVTIDRVENYKGPYADYAMRYLGLKNVVMNNSVEYMISGIEITTSPEPDPDQYYFVETGDKLGKGEKAGLLSLSDAGLILGTIPVTSDSVVKTMIVEKGPAKPTISEMDIFPEVFKYYADVSVFEKVDTIIRKVSIDTMTLERQYLKRTLVEKSPEQKAKEAADFIAKIKENRFNLITGYQEVNYNRETLEYMDTQLKVMEKEYMKLFTGISIHKALKFSYKYIPLPNQINTEIPIFKFSKTKGTQDLDAVGGKVITIKVQRVGNTNNVSSYLGRGEKQDKEQGIFYRIPELARMIVKFDDNTTEETQCLVNQLGLVSNLPVDKWKVIFHKETGGIKGLMIE